MSVQQGTRDVPGEIGQSLFDIVRTLIKMVSMTYVAFRTALVHQPQSLRTLVSVISAQIYFTGYQALPLIGGLALASGAIVIMQSTHQLQLVGGSSMLGNLLVAIIVRELGPLITALIVIARSGTAVASEIGNMKVNREIEALEMLGINPGSYIIVPRVIGGVVSVMCLSFYFIVVALIGGYIVTRLQQAMPFFYYVDMLGKAMSFDDIWIFILKNAFGGSMIFMTCCYQGLQVHKSPTEVPQATTKAVVSSIISIVIFNLTVTTLFYLKSLIKMGVL
jgi:phospholipid/cholesterol/gamma-HCH transport system permease protein